MKSSYALIVGITALSFAACKTNTEVKGRRAGAEANDGGTLNPAQPQSPATQPGIPANPSNPQTGQGVPSRPLPGSPVQPSTTPNTSANPTNPTVPQLPITAECYKSTPFVCKVEALITAKTNAYRAQRGLGQVTHDPKISFVARDWSIQQGKRGSIGHSGFPSQRNALYRTEFSTSVNFGGENVAMFSGGTSGGESDATAEAIASKFAVMWWNSPGHRANMLRSGFKLLGVGVAQSGRGSWYATQVFD